MSMTTPVCIACVHINMNGTAKKYVVMPSDGEMDDYLCNKCFLKIGDESISQADVQTVCMDHVRPMLEAMTKIESDWSRGEEYGAWIKPSDLEDD